MRVATWNINGLRARLDFLALWLKDRQPDVVGLQELKITDEEFPTELFEDLGYHVLTHGQKSWNGVAVLSREPADLQQCGLPGQEDFGARLITAKVGKLSFTTVYCPNGKDVEHDDFERKLAWYESLTTHWREARADDAHAVICGDFNIVPDAADSWRGEAADGRIFHTKGERARLAEFLGLGLIDLYRSKYPDEVAFSWWDYRGGSFHRGQGLRIDHIYGTQPVSAATDEVVIDRDYRKKKDGLTASDHCPVYADIEI